MAGKNIYQHLIEEHKELPYTVILSDYIFQEMQKLRDLDSSLNRLERQKLELKKKYEEDLAVIEERIKHHQSSCKHRIQNYHAAGSDSYSTCDHCGKEL